MKNYFMENLSWPKINDYLKRSNLILIPLGATEEHGKHLPISMDTCIAVNLCEKVSEKAKCLVAPTIPMGYSEWFMEFPGTISFSYNLLIQLIQEYCDSLVSHGFKNLIFISPHGLNATAIGIVGRILRNKGVIVSMINPWKILSDIGLKYWNGQAVKETVGIITGIEDHNWLGLSAFNKSKFSIKPSELLILTPFEVLNANPSVSSMF